MTSDKIKSIFGGKVRIRVMGLYCDQDKLLLINHSGLNTQNEYWMPPGGGVEFGETCEEALIREFKEELNVQISVGTFLFFNEFISEELHAIEMFFEISSLTGNLKLGIDPEMKEKQILNQYDFVQVDSLKNGNNDILHPVLLNLQKLEDLFVYRGFLKF